MRQMHYCYLAVLLLGLSACSTAKNVPDMRSDQFPDIKFEALNPRSIRVDVKNFRKVNQVAGNTSEVESAIKKALADVFSRGGLTVKSTSPHRLRIEASDYTGADAEGECVQLKGTLVAKWGSTLYAESYACHYLKHLIGINLGGSVSQAYDKALRVILNYMETHQNQMLGY